jgi:TRAP-type C4-dicarboxylate transport system substrate-binding protein
MIKQKCWLIVLGIIVLAFLSFTSNQAEAKTYTIKFATSHPPVIPSGSILQELEKVIPEKTNGRVKFKPFLGGSLYSDYAAPTQIAAGGLEMSYGGYNMASISEGWNAIAGLPYIIDSYEHYLRFCETDAFKKLNKNLEAKGIKFIAHAGHPGFSDLFNSKRAVKNLDDFKGLKLRIPPIPGLTKMCEVFGAQNVTIDMAEVSSALQTGMVDGTFAPVMKLKGYSLISNAPFATVANTTFIPQEFVANTKFWNSLPEDLQKILQNIFIEYGKKCNIGFRGMETKLWGIYKKGPGTTVHELTASEKKKWQIAVRPIWKELTEKSKEAKMIVEAIEATR